MNTFSEIINIINKFKKIRTNKDVAKLLNINYRTFTTQKRRTSIPHDALISFCRTENISIDDIFGEADGHPGTDFPQHIVEETKISYINPQRRDNYLRICTDCKDFGEEDLKDILTLIDVLKSPDIITKDAIKKNLAMFKHGVDRDEKLDTALNDILDLRAEIEEVKRVYGQRGWPTKGKEK
jgi:hypothetical protein